MEIDEVLQNVGMLLFLVRDSDIRPGKGVISDHEISPAINVIQDLFCTRLSMLQFEILLNPCDQVVLKYSLDDLVQNVGCNQHMNVGTWEVVREWLKILVNKCA